MRQPSKVKGKNCSMEKCAKANNVEEIIIERFVPMKEVRDAKKKPRNITSSQTGAANEARSI